MLAPSLAVMACVGAYIGQRRDNRQVEADSRLLDAVEAEILTRGAQTQEEVIRDTTQAESEIARLARRYADRLRADSRYIDHLRAERDQARATVNELQDLLGNIRGRA